MELFESAWFHDGMREQSSKWMNLMVQSGRNAHLPQHRYAVGMQPAYEVPRNRCVIGQGEFTRVHDANAMMAWPCTYNTWSAGTGTYSIRRASRLRGSENDLHQPLVEVT